MALTFTFVPPVKSGDPITSTQAKKIADAFNDRLRCNAGDGCERIAFLLFSQFRQMRNSDGGFLFPSQSEFFHFFQNLKANEGQWPTMDPGDPEGANVASILNAFVFGGEAVDLFSEDLRIAEPTAGGVPLWYGGGVPSDPVGIWELGKQQRGAVSLSGAIGSPAFAAAVEHYKIRSSPVSPHGNSYGGFMPVPVDLADCDDPLYPDLQIFFTNLRTGEVMPIGGTCPERPGDVANVFKTPLFYYVWLNNGSLILLPIEDWIEGPYDGGSAIKKNWGEFIPRALNAWANDFRGTPSERATQTRWLQYAFDRERFLASQYLLSPNIGTESAGVITEVYPLFRGTCAPGTSLAAGVNLTHQQSGGPEHSYAAGFMFTGALVTAEKLAASCTVEFWNGDTLLKSAVLTPDGSGNAAAIVMLDEAVEGPSVEVILPGGASFTDAAGFVQAECTELMKYKPQHHDLYLMLRLATCRTTLVSGLDGSGEDEDNSNEISDSYFANGCVLNSHGAPGPAGSFAGEVNSNAVFDAARRLSQFVRILPRDGFIGYAVEDGKSVCWFRRHTMVSGVPIDQFEGIGPSSEPVASGDLVAGKRYVVRGNSITYNGSTIVQDATFVADSGAEFTGAGLVYERDGIRATAEPEGFTNEWLMGSWLKVYKLSDDSIWKPEAYSDYFTISERCHWKHGIGGAPGYTKDLQRQFDYGSNESLAPEAFSGWRYVHNTNRWECTEGDLDCESRRRDRYKSCRIYEPLPEIESAVEDIEEGVAVIKLTFKGRFHHHESAPEAIDRNMNTWEISALHGESYRTMENGLREYLVLQWDGSHCTGGGSDPGIGHNLGQQGNSAFMRNTDSDPWGNPDTPHGACFPHFYFVKLFPRPFQDANDVQDALDTPLWADWWAQADLYLRAMCEGFVDGQTSVDLACTLGDNAVFCYTFESLCFASHQRKWLTALATEKTRLLKKVREDGPEGFGQAPALSAAAECYNQLAGCLNLLTKVQIMLPQKFQTRGMNGTATTSVAATWPPSGPPTCSTGFGSPVGYYTGTPVDASATAPDPWADALSVVSIVAASISNDTCNGAAWVLQTTRSDAEWRWALIDPDAFYALPEVWQGIFSDDGGEIVSLHGRLLGVHQISDIRKRARNVSVIGSSSSCGGVAGYWVDPSGGYIVFDDDVAEDLTECVLFGNSGRLSTNALGASDFAIGRDPVTGNSCMGAAQRSESITPILGEDASFVEIPLV